MNDDLLWKKNIYLEISAWNKLMKKGFDEKSSQFTTIFLSFLSFSWLFSPNFIKSFIFWKDNKTDEWNCKVILITQKIIWHKNGQVWLNGRDLDDFKLFLFIYLFYFPTHDWYSNHLKHLGRTRLVVITTNQTCVALTPLPSSLLPLTGCEPKTFRPWAVFATE